MCPVYLASITIGFTDGAGGQAQLSFASEVIGMGSPATPQQHRGLLGRDFLLHVDKFVYDGKAGTFDLVLNTPAPTLPGVMTREQKDALKAKHKAERQARKKTRRR